MTDRDREPFLHTIRQHADHDGGRLVYADWLEEQGDSDRAEFIRLGCELASLPANAPTDQNCPRCGKGGRWRSGVGFEHEKICFGKNHADGHPFVWEPGVAIENPKRDDLAARLLDLFRRHGQAWFGTPLGGKIGVQCGRCNGGLWMGVFDTKSGSCEKCINGRIVEWPLTVQVPCGAYCQTCRGTGQLIPMGLEAQPSRCPYCSDRVHATLTIARGFGDVLTCPTLASFMGERCERCSGDGNCLMCGGSGEVGGAYFADDGMQPCDDCRNGVCPACDGKLAPGIAATVFKTEPIRSVTISDRVPYRYRAEYSHLGGGERDWYRWWCYAIPEEAPEDQRSALLPREIYEWCGSPSIRQQMPFATAELAQAALSDALRRWANGVK